MKALVYEGPFQMTLREIEEPQPTSDDVIVRVKASGICGSDVHGFKGATGRRKPPIVMGHEFSGEIIAIGDNIKDYQVGDRVVVQPLLSCGICESCLAGTPNICMNRSGLGMNLNGAFAEKVRVPQKMLYRLPSAMTWEQGAMIEPLSVAMHAVNLAPFQLMDSVIIIGAGTIGLLVILAALMKGAGKLIVVDLNKRRLEIARKLGADLIINSQEEDTLSIVKKYTNQAGASTVIEAVGITPTAKQSLTLARNGGTVIWIGNSNPEVTINMQQIVTRELTVRGVYGFNREFSRAIEAIRFGKVDIQPLVEKITSLEEGPQIIQKLATGELDYVKVLLKP